MLYHFSFSKQIFHRTLANTSDEGFTLIELSIVLVIIGLIIGGILVGRELITAAETRAQITQIEKYNTAVNTFRSKYGGLPGDLAVATANQFGFSVAASCLGNVGQRDGNGLIDGWGGGLQYSQTVGETALFWQDLGTAKLIDGQFPSNGSANLAVSISDGDHLPPPKSQTGVPFITIGNIEKATRTINFADTFIHVSRATPAS